jgi:hypothetical protein
MEKNEELKSGTSTQTAVEENVNKQKETTGTKENEAYEGDLKDLIGEGKYNICAPLFLMFAEYLGYVGKTLPWVDEWCVNKKKPEPYKVKFIEIEAVTVLKEAKKAFTEQKLRELYDGLYEVILFIYDENLKAMEKEEQEKADRKTT